MRGPPARNGTDRVHRRARQIVPRGARNTRRLCVLHGAERCTPNFLR
ncbi:hypothetical protein BDSB_28305 [Burkholderia dolosa PC543]|nr:hypothetical protein BDSB_28305 [Burkholderia dolosa PC543]